MKVVIKTKDKNLRELVRAAKQLKEVIDHVDNVLVDRSEELTALMLCLLTREHLLLDGPHGIAKSRLVDEVFSRITGAKLFATQLFKGSIVDEVFGPLNAKRYKEDAVWERNINGTLATCDLAFIDEVYRASDMLLPSMMSVLNERIYRNGTVTVQCPLGTAVGTCNFITENRELEAIHDRWLCQMHVKPLKHSSSRVKMLLGEYVRRRNKVRDDSGPTIDITDLRLLQNYVSKISVPEQAIEMYEDMVARFRSQSGGGYISDRRLFQSLRLAQAYYLFSGPCAVADRKPLPMENLAMTRYGLVTSGKEEDAANFMQAFDSIIGESERIAKANDDITMLHQAAQLLKSQYDPSLSKVEATELLMEVTKLLSVVENMPEDRKPRMESSRVMLASLTADLVATKQSLNDSGIV